jgi:hypothetical protein
MRKAERKAQGLLERAIADHPDRVRLGSPPSVIAPALGHQIITRQLHPGEGGKFDPLLRRIIVAPNPYQPHVEFVIAHETLELRKPRNVPAEFKEDYCDRGAAALMMPARTFLDSGAACDWELEVLSAWWPHCSPLALLRRITDLMAGSAVSAWTRSRMKLRVGDLPPDTLEEFVASEALHGSGRSEVQLGGVRVRAWRNGDGRALALVQRVA